VGFWRNVSFAIAAALFLTEIGGGSAMAFPTQDDNTLGTMALKYKKRSNWWSRVDLSLVDAKVVTTPPDSAKIDRRIEGFSNLGFDVNFGKYGFRFNGELEHSHRRQAEEDASQAIVESTRNKIRPSIDFTFETDKGLELFIGAEETIAAKYKESITTENRESSTNFEQVRIKSNRAGLCRRAGVWSGGLYYIQGGESKVEFTKQASDGTSLTRDEKVFIPAETGMFGEFTAGTIVWDFDLSFVQARGEGPRDVDGNTIYTDYIKAKFGAYGVLGGVGIHSQLAHQTLSYSNSAFITLDSIPVTHFKIETIFGDLENHSFVGLGYAQGKDGQSLPEFNAKYKLEALMLSVGLRYGI